MYETIRLKIRKFYIKMTAKIRNNKIKNKDFTIISNNCWGGLIYQSYNLKYRTPTLGMFFMAEDYIKFISDIKEYFNCKLEFIKPEKSKWYNKLKDTNNYGQYPIAKLNDIELFFLHYSTEEEVQKKWDERKKRINYSNILYKFSDMNCCEEKHIKAFQRLPLKNKICFLSRKYENFENDYTHILNNQKDKIKASYEPFGKSKYVNINQIINNLRK